MSETQEPKPQKINRLDPAWAVFAAIFAQAERDRRDRGECEGPLDQEEWDEMQKARRDEA